MAKQEALDLHSNKVGTEHLLLALAKEDEGIAAEALRSLDISYDDIMDTLKEVQTTVPEPSEETEAAKLAFTPLVISVMERSFRVARTGTTSASASERTLLVLILGSELFDGLFNGSRRHAQAHEDVHGHAVALFDDADQQVLGRRGQRHGHGHPHAPGRVVCFH